MPYGNRAPTIAERFGARNLFKMQASGCWLWPCQDGRYGKLTWQHKTILAHRLSWELHVGPIPQGSCVLHRCDQPRCVNPRHLFLGSLADNNRDALRKGRSVRGERHPLAKLTEADVRYIRHAWRFAEVRTKAELARRFGVSETKIGQILSGRSWRLALP